MIAEGSNKNNKQEKDHVCPYALQIATFGDPARVVELVAAPQARRPGAGNVLVAGGVRAY